jgi:hypothetical protein
MTKVSARLQVSSKFGLGCPAALFRKIGTIVDQVYQKETNWV